MIILEPSWEKFLVTNKEKSISNCAAWFKKTIEPLNDGEKILPIGKKNEAEPSDHLTSEDS